MMLRGQTDLVAVVVGGFYNPFHTITLESFARALASVGKRPLLVQVESDRALDEAVGDLVELRVAGVLSALSVSSHDVAAELDRHRLPIVTLNSAIETDWIRVVSSDNAGAGAQAARRLHDAGARRFAWIVGPAEAIAHSQRARGFIEELNRLSMVDVTGAYGNYSYDWGWAMGEQLLKGSERPDGIFCANDMIAMGFMDSWAAKGGLRAPHDFRIIGYDNIPAAAWPGYALTSFDQNTDRMAQIGVQTLLDFSSSKNGTRVVPPTLVNRRTA
jgi:DNA-binding LacI/PurR family transcriptional regulator